MSDVTPACLLEPTDPLYVDMPCHGYFTDICECQFRDIFFERAYVPTIFGECAPQQAEGVGRGIAGVCLWRVVGFSGSCFRANTVARGVKLSVNGLGSLWLSLSRVSVCPSVPAIALYRGPVL